MALAEAPKPELLVDFDADEDVLYVSLGAPVPSHAEEAEGGVLLRRSDDEDRPSGVTAFDFLQNWRDRRQAFYAMVAGYLQLPERQVEHQIEHSI
jgi:hypothetical protein